MSGGICEILYEDMVCEIRKSLTEMVSLLKSQLPVVSGMVLRKRYVKEHCMMLNRYLVVVTGGSCSGW